MWDKPKPAVAPVTPSKKGTSGPRSDDESAQLSEPDGVNSDVSSLALDSRLLAVGVHPPDGAAGSATEISDAEMMLRVKAGDDSAFDFLVQKYRHPMIGFMYRIARNTAAAEDLAQEVFLRVYRSRANYEPTAKFSTWLYRIATNLGVNHARDTRHERTAQNVYLDQPDPETGTSPDVADSTPTVEQELVRDERMNAIRQHVMALP